MASANMQATITFHLTAYYLVPIEGDYLRFSLIHGYESSESNFHYSEFAGFDLDNEPCWVLTYSELPSDAIIIPLECGEAIIKNTRPIK